MEIKNEKIYLKLLNKSRNRIVFLKSGSHAYLGFMPDISSSRKGFTSVLVDQIFITDEFKKAIQEVINNYLDAFGPEHETKTWSEDKMEFRGTQVRIYHEPERDLELYPNIIVSDLDSVENLMKFKRIDISALIQYSEPWSVFAWFDFNASGELNGIKAIDLSTQTEKPLWSVISLLCPKDDEVKSQLRMHVFFDPKKDQDYFLVLRAPSLDFIQEVHQILSKLTLK